MQEQKHCADMTELIIERTSQDSNGMKATRITENAMRRIKPQTKHYVNRCDLPF